MGKIVYLKQSKLREKIMEAQMNYMDEDGGMDDFAPQM